ncbi:hypothetical protein FHU41_000712 [Psychromicrobium silvestre]|uniref:Tandem-95 repeat protein n=1 Tax=Psychromicrobium silvestre TaxID=1645614 RepID=A0A7Y9S6A2_9MICC|nr:Ig-like domain-containing protein [Psychromicrobium silvestre]NYE94491.1 hypothetical protein [Psychromicrobium silvestre]
MKLSILRRWGVIGLVAAGFLLGPVSTPAFAAPGGGSGGGGNPLVTAVSVDYLGSTQSSVTSGVTITACPKVPTSPELSVTCAPDGTITFTSLGYNPATAQQPVMIEVTPAGSSVPIDLVFNVTMNPPAPPTADSRTYDVPFSEGTQATVPFTDITYTCPGCSATAGPTFNAVGVNPPGAGQVSLDPVRGFVFTPAPDFTGTVTIDFTVTDPFGQASKPATLTLSYVKAASKPPIAAIDTLSMKRNTTGTVNVLTNDVDPNGGQLTVSTCGTPAHGQVTCNPDGTATYTPNADFTGLDQFSYVVVNSSGDQASSTVVIGVETDPSTVVQQITNSHQTVVRPSVTNSSTVTKVIHQGITVPGVAITQTAPVGVFTAMSSALMTITGQLAEGGPSGHGAGGQLASTGVNNPLPVTGVAVAMLLIGTGIVVFVRRATVRSTREFSAPSQTER